MKQLKTDNETTAQEDDIASCAQSRLHYEIMMHATCV